MFVIIISLLVIFYSLFYLLGKFFDEKKCYVCGYLGEKAYMIQTNEKSFRHYSCINCGSE